MRCISALVVFKSELKRRPRESEGWSLKVNFPTRIGKFTLCRRKGWDGIIQVGRIIF